MKKFHVHVRVKDLQESMSFYNALFNVQPSVEKPDYAKWMLEDPNVNFAISTGYGETGIEHLGLQVESTDELQEVYSNMQKTKTTIYNEGESTCCYANSKKSWVSDPQGVEWEAFYTHGEATVYGEGVNQKPSPETMDTWTGNENNNGVKESKTVACCK